MKTIKIFRNIALGTLACTMTVACTDLDENPKSIITTEKHEFTDNELNATIAAVYTDLQSVYWGWFGMMDIMEMSADVWGVPSRIGIGWGDLYVSFHKHTFNSELGFFEQNWLSNYAGVKACNQALADERVSSDPTRESQIRAHRALYYYHLFDLYRNIPLDTTFVHEDGWLPEQAQPEVTYNYIMKELDAVMDILPTDVEMGKFNQYAAHMLKAKMYLNHNAWFQDDSDDSYYKKCIDELNQVIAGPFSLAPNYSDNFVEDISNSPEIIFGIPLENKYAGGNYMANLWMHTAGRVTWNFEGWATGGGIVFPQFLETYDEDDQRYTDCWISGPQYDSKGEPIYVQGEQLNYTRELHSIDNPGCYPFESERLVKYEILSGDFGTNYDDVPYFRLADAYLMKAECLLRLGGYNGETEQDAADLVTKVRERDFKSNPSKATVTVAQLKGGSKYAYGHRENQGKQGEADKWIITEEGGDDIELGGLLDELAWEFVAEAHRRDDLVRFKINGTNMNVYNGKSWFCKDAVDNRDNDIFPIPQVALDGNPKLKQNPGY